MLITQNFRIVRILKTTWQIDVLIVVICSITYYLHEYVVPNPIKIPATVATLMGTAIAFFLGFNNSQAYDRWWEARTIWGALVNDSRSWARNMIHNIVPGDSQEDISSVKSQMVRRHLGFVYALKEGLRGKKDGYYKRFLTPEEVAKVTQESNVHNAILTLNAVTLQQLSDANIIDGFRFLQFNQLLTAFTDHMGKCERIKNTVFPTSYVFYTRLFIFVLTIFITLILSDAIGLWSILIGWIFGFIFHITHQNGMYLMNPFEEIATGIPLNQIARTIEINLLEMLGEENIPEPDKPVNNEYYL